ncbi:hypothetical protein AABB24_029950 [Solanum stoloniferum]|uniref:Uncharacterized protein n=1 Tax=Solanum stoloniferum TaxID=62892 RepID=A0ABD2S052_9SOLN
MEYERINKRNLQVVKVYVSVFGDERGKEAALTNLKSKAKSVVKVYVSVFGAERGKEVALTGLKSKAKYMSELGRRMKLRLTLEICFIEDESLERGRYGLKEQAENYMEDQGQLLLLFMNSFKVGLGETYPDDNEIDEHVLWLLLHLITHKIVKEALDASLAAGQARGKFQRHEKLEPRCG